MKLVSVSLLLLSIFQSPAHAGRKSKPRGDAPRGMLMPDLSAVLGEAWTVPPELSDRPQPGTVLELTETGLRVVMRGCVGAASTESSLTNVSMQNSLSGGVGWGAGVVGASVNAEHSLRLSFQGPTVRGFDLIDFVPTEACKSALASYLARGGDLSRLVLVQEALLARVSGCETNGAAAGVSVAGGGGGVAASGACQMFSDAPVVVGMKAVALTDLRELSGLGRVVSPTPPPVAAAPPVAATPVPRPASPSAAYPMRPVPAGTYTLGCTAGQRDCFDNERVHRVTLGRAFWMGVHEVTQGLYAEVMGSNPSYFPTCGATCPVERVSWFDAVHFANALSRREGLEECYRISGESVTWPRGPLCTGYRLPTEAEWEVAARGGADSLYAGSNDAAAVAWFGDTSGESTHPVGQKAANGYGLYDMSGNVWEWVWDWYGEYSGASSDPQGPASGSFRVLRGGSWDDSAVYLRVADRVFGHPAFRYDILGFRLARTLP